MPALLIAAVATAMMFVAGAARAEAWDPCADNPCPEQSRCKPQSGGWICLGPDGKGGTVPSVSPEAQRRMAIAQLSVGYSLLAPGIAFTVTGIWLAAPPWEYVLVGFPTAIFGLLHLSVSIPLIILGHTRHRRYMLNQKAHTAMVTPFVAPTQVGFVAGLTGRF